MATIHLHHHAIAHVAPEPPELTGVNPEEREHMIAEAAYYRYLNRGATAGHDLDDWLAAEEDFEGAKLRRTPPDVTKVMLLDMEQRPLGAAEADALRRVTRQHPRRETPSKE